MSEKKSIFQAVILGILVILIFIAILVFSLHKGDSVKYAASVTAWGTLDAETFSDFLGNRPKEKPIKIDYTRIDPAIFEQQLTNALAEGGGPDVIITSSDFILENTNKLYTIPYKSFSLKNYRDRFAEVSESNLRKNGILAFPILIDPLVMFWNRDIFSKAAISLPPKYWDELLANTQKITTKDSNLLISKAGVAMGEFRNISSAKNIFLTLLLQAGDSMFVRESGEDGDIFKNIFSSNLGFKLKPAEAALVFYTQFADPSKDVYSWNRSLPDASDMFSANNLAIYFGNFSEYQTILRKNPNLNFDIARMPQSRAEDSSAVYGTTYVAAISKNSKKPAVALQYILAMLEDEPSKELADGFAMVSPKRSVLAKTPDSPEDTVAYESALIMKPIYEPMASKLEGILSTMIESYLAGISRTDDIIGRASDKLDLIVDKLNENAKK